MAGGQVRFGRLRHPMAAVLGVAGILVGSIAAIGVPATAAAGDLVQTMKFSCAMSTFPAYDWEPTITLSAVRPAASTTVTVSAHMSDMAGKSPAPLMNYDATDELVLDIGGTAVSLKGAGKVNAAANAPFALPDMEGTFTSSDPDAAIEVTTFGFKVLALTGTCTPTASTALGTLTIVEGTPPTAKPVPTTTTSATSKPKPSTTATSSASEGKAAKGTVTFTCKLSINPDPFEYKAATTVSGYRESEGDDVSLVATMSDLPGMSPVAIQGSMDYTLDAKVGGEKVTLKSTGDVNAQPKAVVPVEDLAGSVDVEGDELAVVVTGFTFNFPSGGVGAECTADSVALSKMTVGSEPIDTDPGTSSTTTTGGSTLPKTGGGDSMPVVALWALALTLLGAAGLLCVPRTRRQH
jgi:LPXTG-motif cell wall-anchored protein